MQEDSDNKATPQPQLDQKLQAVIQIYWQGCIVFLLFSPVGSSTNIRWYVWCWQYRRFRRGFKNTHKHVPRRHLRLKHSRVPSKELHNALPSHNPNVRKVFSDQQGCVLGRCLTCQLSETIKSNNLVEKFLSSGIRPNAKDLQCLVFRINTYYNNRKKRAGILLRVMHTRR